MPTRANTQRETKTRSRRTHANKNIIVNKIKSNAQCKCVRKDASRLGSQEEPRWIPTGDGRGVTHQHTHLQVVEITNVKCAEVTVIEL